MDMANEIEKTAGWISDLSGLPKSIGGGALWLSALAGIAGGAGLGILSSKVKAKNRKILSLDRKKKYYDSKIQDMQNENWLNDIMAIRRKLETSKLDESTRKELEKKYLELIDK